MALLSDKMSNVATSNLLAQVPDLLPELEDIYRDLHSHPEVSHEEERTAGVVAAYLRDLGCEVTEGVGGFGVVGVIANGAGPVVWLRADMDALPMQEKTGLSYASKVSGVSHSCGHDMHVACGLGAAATLISSRSGWSGTVVMIFQPAEEVVDGAKRMIADNLFERFPKPDVILGQHVAPLPAGTIFYRHDAAMAACDNYEIRLFGKGGHGSRPETTIDPIVMAASLVMRLQTIVAREVPPNRAAVVTVGSITAGTKDNIIGDEAVLRLTLRSFEPEVRKKITASMIRMANAEALASGSPREPEIIHTFQSPVVVNDESTLLRVVTAFEAKWGESVQEALQPATGSEDFNEFADASGAPSMYWFLGGADPAPFLAAADVVEMTRIFEGIPSNHAPEYAPVIEPTLQMGIEALVLAGLAWLEVT